MYKYVQKFVKKCGIYQVEKGVSQNTRLYKLVSILEKPWSDINRDFVLFLLRIVRVYDYIIFCCG